MTAESIVRRFVEELDEKSEYSIRYEKEQRGQIEFAQQIAAHFPTPPATRIGCFQRSNKAVAATFANKQHVEAWRQSYAMMPTDSITIVEQWLIKMLSNPIDDSKDVHAASCFLFASRSTIEFVPTIEDYCGLLCACWTTTEKTGMPRLVPLIYSSISKQNYERLARALPTTTQWSAYPQVHSLLDALQIPKGARKNNLPRVMLVGLIDAAQWLNPRFDLLLQKLPRGRADLFNLALGHRSRSFLIWPYMGMTVGVVGRHKDANVVVQSPLVQFVPTDGKLDEELYITRELSLQLKAAADQLRADEQKMLESKRLVEELNKKARVEAQIVGRQPLVSVVNSVPAAPAVQQPSTLPDVLSLTDDE